MPDITTEPSILLCTVGTGNVDQLRESLLTPLLKSIAAGQWRRVILLPSLATAANAAILQAEACGAPIEISPLPRLDMEDDADACFAHFDAVIGGLRAAGTSPAEILVDFTRGTKVMSAALVLAAVRHELPRLRYLSGERRDSRGMVVPGTETIRDVHTIVVSAARRLDDAYRFLQRGAFAAAQDLLSLDANPDAAPWPEPLAIERAAVLSLAAFYAAWDRLDYKSANGMSLPDTPAAALDVGIGGNCGGSGTRESSDAIHSALLNSHEFSYKIVNNPRWAEFFPAPAARKWVADLAADLPDEPTQRAGHLRLLACDLLANGRRRLRDHQFEDCVIRAYRILELVGQFRLCDRGIHSDDVPAENPVVQEFLARLARKKSTVPVPDSRGRLLFAREVTARLLKQFGDPFAERLLQLGNEGAVAAKKRNNSALIHGFEAAGGNDPVPLRDLYEKLEKLLIDDDARAANWLRAARALDLQCRNR